MNPSAGSGLSGLWHSLTGKATVPAAAPSSAPTAAIATGAGLPFESTHYQRLGLAEDCTEAEIEIAWHRVSADLLPPLPPAERLKPQAASAGAADEARSAQRRADDRRLAHAVLSDPARRAVYDAWLARERAARPPQGWLTRLRGR